MTCANFELVITCKKQIHHPFGRVQQFGASKLLEIIVTNTAIKASPIQM